MYSKYNLSIWKEYKIIYKIYSILINDESVYNDYLKLYKEWKKLNENISKETYDNLNNRYNNNYEKYENNILEIINSDKINDDILLENIRYMFLDIDELINDYRYRNISKLEFENKINILITYCEKLKLLDDGVIKSFKETINKII